MSSLKPSANLLNCSSIRFWMRQFVTRLWLGTTHKKGEVLDVFALVCVGDRDVLAVWFEIDGDNFAEPVVFG